jgi:hypothetical protein
MSQVLEKVWLGSKRDAASREFLKDIGVSHILTIETEFPPLFPNVRKEESAFNVVPGL